MTSMLWGTPAPKYCFRMKIPDEIHDDWIVPSVDFELLNDFFTGTGVGDLVGVPEWGTLVTTNSSPYVVGVGGVFDVDNLHERALTKNPRVLAKIPLLVSSRFPAQFKTSISYFSKNSKNLSLVGLMI